MNGMTTTLPADASMAAACERAVLAFTHGFDMNDIDAMSRHFAPDGVWKRHDGDLVGMEQLRHFMQVRHPGTFVRHVLSNLRTSLLPDGHAVVDSYVTVYRHDFKGAPQRPAPLAGPNVVGRYRDQLALGDKGWQLVQREVQIDFKQQEISP